MKKTVFYISFLIILFITNSCIEEFNAATTEFEDAIVIEASLTDQLAFQKVLLSRTFKIDDTQNQLEKVSGANVRVVSNSTTYTFSETTSGTYTSDIQFRAELDTDYQLLVTTQNGNEYQSEVTQLRSDTSNIENLYAVREINDDGVDGVSIYLDSFDPSGNSIYYTLDIQETYQIIVPLWVKDGFHITSQDPFLFNIGPRTQEERVCYNTINAKGRLVTNTSLLSEDRISRFLVKFIPFNDIRLNSRYSILVKQYTNTKRAYDFHETLTDLSSSGSIFSPVQPGFVAGNIVSVNNPNERVLGFFEVASIREERMFFNAEDFYPEGFDWNCRVGLPPETTIPLSTLIRTRKVSYFSGSGGAGSPIEVVFRRCGDCTKSGSNIKPNFWID